MPDAENIFIQQASHGITSHSIACRPHENTEDTSNDGVDSSSTAPTIFFKDVRLVTNRLRGFFFAAILCLTAFGSVFYFPRMAWRLRSRSVARRIVGSFSIGTLPI